MPTTTSEIFEFLDRQSRFVVERHEISSTAFGAMRHGMRTVFMKLRESGDQDAEEAADRLRNLLSEWLTVPVPFDGAILGALKNFGSPVEVGVRWGSDIRTNYETALRGAQKLQEVENPARTCLRHQIRDLRKTGRTLKIYCHRTARPHFDSLLASDERPLGSDDFLHSVRDYRDSPIFDIMIKVGPLRSWGWFKPFGQDAATSPASVTIPLPPLRMSETSRPRPSTTTRLSLAVLHGPPMLRGLEVMALPSQKTFPSRTTSRSSVD
jgi:hypothetical protein